MESESDETKCVDANGVVDGRQNGDENTRHEENDDECKRRNGKNKLRRQATTEEELKKDIEKLKRSISHDAGGGVENGDMTNGNEKIDKS